MRVLVTGGAGFIGSRVVERLLTDASVEAVGVLDNLSAGMPMPAPADRIKPMQVDIRNEKDVLHALDDFQPDGLIHLAAIHHIPTCEHQRSLALEVNVVGTELMLAAAEARSVERVVLASSGAVYGWADGALDEGSTALSPADNYSLSKFTNEQQLRFWCERTNRQGLVARIFNTIGTRDPNAHLIPDILAQVLDPGFTDQIVLGNISPRRDYIHVEDTARALVSIFLSPGDQNYDVFNICTGIEYSVADLVGIVSEVVDRPIRIAQDEAKRRRIDRPSQLGSTEKLRRYCAFTPSKTVREAVEEIFLER